jgi:hypothetical protein
VQRQEKDMTAKATTIQKTIENALCPIAYATLANKGLERMIEAGKITLDLAGEQNADILATMKKALKDTPLANMPMLDLVGLAVQGYIDVQKNLMEQMLEQSNDVLRAMEGFGVDANKAKAELSNMLQASLDRSTAAQTSVYEYAIDQTKAGINAVKKQPGIAGTGVELVANSIESAFDTAMETQKAIVILATKPLKALSVGA